MDTRPVGIIDSGVGGMSVYRAFRALAPAEDVLYFADTQYFPYGPRPEPEVRKRAFAATRRLLDGDAKLIIVACNTASAAALAELREAFSFVPFVGMVPGLKPAAAASRSRHLAILATAGTLDGRLYDEVVREFGQGTRIENIPAPSLAELVEGGAAGTAEAVEAVHRALAPAVEAGVDTVVLGCTHYAFLVGDIREAFPALTVIDTSDPVARRAVALLDEHGLRNDESRTGHLDLVVTGDRRGFEENLAALGFAPAVHEAGR